MSNRYIIVFSIKVAGTAVEYLMLGKMVNRVLVDCGLRLGELLNLKMSDVDM
ncbi:hypothetical protein ACFLXZ_00430 [Chloroflexota bacterium]